MKINGKEIKELEIVSVVGMPVYLIQTENYWAAYDIGWSLLKIRDTREGLVTELSKELEERNPRLILEAIRAALLHSGNSELKEKVDFLISQM